MVYGLGAILLIVLFGPVMFKPIEQNIEVFFLVVGAFASAISGQWGGKLLRAAMTEPIALTAAVLIFGVVVRLAGGSITGDRSRTGAALSPGHHSTAALRVVATVTGAHRLKKLTTEARRRRCTTSAATPAAAARFPAPCR